MALTSTLFTGLSGLDVNQTRLNVVGNNIANINTVGFKSSRALFKPQFYITDAAGSPPSSSFGGENPSQRGLGATVATIQKNFSAGSLETTGKNTDMAIDGDGFFVVQGKEQKFTRDGSFILNQNNELTTTGGDFVQGFGVDADNNIIPGQLQNISIPLGSLTKAQETSTVELTGNLNASGAVSTIGNVTTATNTLPDASTLLTDLRVADPTTGLATGAAIFTDAQQLDLAAKRGGRTLPELSLTVVGTSTTLGELQTFVNQATGIDGNVTSVTSAPGTTLVAGSGALVNSVQIRVESNAGTQNGLSFAGTSLGSDLAIIESSAAVGESVYTSTSVYDSLGTPLQVNLVTTLESRTNEGTTWRFYAYSGDDTDAAVFDPTGASEGIKVATGTISFDTKGKLSTTAPLPIQLHRELTGAGDPLAFSLDFSNMNALSSASSTDPSNMFGEADGKGIGTLNGFEISADGRVTGAFDNGLRETLGQIAIASFDNPEGLVDGGGNMYIQGGNSGTAKVTAPLQLAAGGIRSATLELSNVDLSEEFVNLIISSTGFTAASRVISTSDQLLTELLNTSR